MGTNRVNSSSNDLPDGRGDLPPYAQSTHGLSCGCSVSHGPSRSFGVAQELLERSEEVPEWSKNGNEGGVDCAQQRTEKSPEYELDCQNEGLDDDHNPSENGRDDCQEGLDHQRHCVGNVDYEVLKRPKYWSHTRREDAPENSNEIPKRN